MANLQHRGGADTVVPGDAQVFPRLFALDPLSSEEAGYQAYLLDRVAARAGVLGLPREADAPDAAARLTPGCGLPESDLLPRLLEAIEAGHETGFVDHLARFWNVWGAHHAGARHGFNDAMARLFVTRRFPSVATRSV